MNQAEWWERAKRVYELQGYVVLCSPVPYKIGYIVEAIRDDPGRALPQPFMITADATKEEFLHQRRLAGFPERPIESNYFYRAVTE